MSGPALSGVEGPLLSIENLRTYFYSRAKRAFIRSVDGASVSVARGETLGIVGESGSGKTVTALSAAGLVTAGPGVISGRIELRTNGTGYNLLDGLEKYARVTEQDGRVMAVEKDERGWRTHSEKLMAGVRGKTIAMIFQNPRSALNPYSTVGSQLVETIRLHTSFRGKRESKERAIHWLERVRIDSPGLRFDNFPFGMSGGMCQRAMIAMALCAEPSLLIADEPTTGLDATIQSRIVDLLAELKAETAVATILISHDISVIQRLSDRVAVMYGGTVVETGRVEEVLAPEVEARHPYTAALLASIPNAETIRRKSYLQAIEGDVLDTIDVPRGCRFYGRCNRVTDAVRERCAGLEPPLAEVAPGHKMRCWLYPASANAAQKT
ncbi:MAG TPA: ABC transporter ATP-binding protein [Burkholderiales bacterium]|nr:ABC transporter ATP-binding protein [Burkholderiales bacterium]